MEDALDLVLPEVARAVPRVRLGEWPTPIEPLDLPAGRGDVRPGDVWVKREDRSSPLYGGNKIRPLETVFARWRDLGVRRVWATGAWGSNQALGTAVHAPRADLSAGAVLFPQPPSRTAAENLACLLSTEARVTLLPTIALFPFAVAARAASGRRTREVVMAPGAAVPLGALGHLGAALEVALAVDRGEIPPPRHVVLPVGSTCTTAGLLVGFAVASRIGLGFPSGPPHVHAVRVTPWPVTARFRILDLARRTAALLARLGGPDVADSTALPAALDVTGRYLGRGYGRPTPKGLEAARRFSESEGPDLDTTYSAKAAAFLLDRAAAPDLGGSGPDHRGSGPAGLDGPVLFWSTKSSAPLPPVDPAVLARAPRRVKRWLAAGGA